MFYSPFFHAHGTQTVLNPLLLKVKGFGDGEAVMVLLEQLFTVVLLFTGAPNRTNISIWQPLIWNQYWVCQCVTRASDIQQYQELQIPSIIADVDVQRRSLLVRQNI